MAWIIKVSLSALLVLAALLPDAGASNVPGAMEGLASFSRAAIFLSFAAFLLAVAFYCRSLQTCLRLIDPGNRKADPASVWYMFLIPYNFIEDFFIVIHVSHSLEAEARHNPRLLGTRGYGLVTGVGWCIAQVLSFVPGMAGQIAGGLGLLLWIFHWRFILRINHRLKQNG